jgi:hypothetical protein
MHRSKQLPYSITSARGEQCWRPGKPNRLRCRELETRSNPATLEFQTFPPQPEFSACEIDRGGKRAFNIRAASLSFTLLFPNLLISRLA